ncbi:helix-turn-helix domain-containing protein [Streptomyces sp. NPDC057456]|uniref:helix-turn-helix domain-containing protein n=1 Tax=Streptomyces sp. NPDC057456 TaxID=3346139 RepID=UPI0036B1EA7D
MPRRPTPLNPEDGPRARFALALRQLRDEAGFDAPPIDVIAATTGIKRATLYHAMRGQRVPTLPVLAALVRAYGGDEAEWTKFRSKVEMELERERLALKEQLGREMPPHEEELHGGGPGRSSWPTRNQHIYNLISSLAELDDTAATKILNEGTLAEYVRSGHHGAPDLPHERERAMEARRTQLARIAASEAAEDIENSAKQWAEWRRIAGNPRIRTIAGEARLPFSVVSEVLRGLVDPVDEPENTVAVFNALRWMAALKGGTSVNLASTPDE